MYKLILATHEMCGHSNSDFKIVNSDKGYEETMNEIINYDGEAMYKFSHKEKYEQYGLSGYIFYFDGELGLLTIVVINFKEIEDLINKEIFITTG